MQGDPASSHRSFRGTLILDELGQRRVKSKLDDMEHMLSRLGKILLQLISVYADEHYIRRILQPNFKPYESVVTRKYSEEVIIRMMDSELHRWDIRVISGSTLPSNRWARFDYYLDLYKDEAQILIKKLEGEINKRDNQIDTLLRQLKTAQIEKGMDQVVTKLEVEAEQVQRTLNETLKRYG